MDSNTASLGYIEFNQIVSDLIGIDFLPIQHFAAPNGTTWHAFAAADADSWWYEEPIVWEVFVAEMRRTGGVRPLFFVQGTLLPEGVFIRSEREWAAALMRLLPEVEGWTEMEKVD